MTSPPASSLVRCLSQRTVQLALNDKPRGNQGSLPRVVATTTAILLASAQQECFDAQMGSHCLSYTPQLEGERVKDVWKDIKGFARKLNFLKRVPKQKNAEMPQDASAKKLLESGSFRAFVNTITNEKGRIRMRDNKNTVMAIFKEDSQATEKDSQATEKDSRATFNDRPSIGNNSERLPRTESLRRMMWIPSSNAPPPDSIPRSLTQNMPTQSFVQKMAKQFQSDKTSLQHPQPPTRNMSINSVAQVGAQHGLTRNQTRNQRSFTEAPRGSLEKEESFVQKMKKKFESVETPPQSPIAQPSKRNSLSRSPSKVVQMGARLRLTPSQIRHQRPPTETFPSNSASSGCSADASLASPASICPVDSNATSVGTPSYMSMMKNRPRNPATREPSREGRKNLFRGSGVIQEDFFYDG